MESEAPLALPSPDEGLNKVVDALGTYIPMYIPWLKNLVELASVSSPDQASIGRLSKNNSTRSRNGRVFQKNEKLRELKAELWTLTLRLDVFVTPPAELTGEPMDADLITMDKCDVEDLVGMRYLDISWIRLGCMWVFPISYLTSYGT